MRRGIFSFALVALVAAACGGKVTVDKNTSAGTGGAGGAGTTTGTGGTTGTTVASTTVGTPMTTGTGGPCQRCAEHMNQPNGLPVCDASASLFNAIRTCACVDACLSQCAANLCSGSPLSSPCIQCFDALTPSCAPQFNACVADG